MANRRAPHTWLRGLTTLVVLLAAVLSAPGRAAFLCAQALGAQAHGCCCTADDPAPVPSVERAPCCKVAPARSTAPPSTVPAPASGAAPLALPVAFAALGVPHDPFLPDLPVALPVQPARSVPPSTGPPARLRTSRFLI